ncbi:MAG: threonine/serine exporter family protein [Lachnospiraceae bacterium]|nr:threonine/serine exporter family protein [Lachnospiraceae bacterium]
MNDYLSGAGAEKPELESDYQNWIESNEEIAAILDIGELLLKSGAEVMRVEDTISRLALAYGFVRADVFTITSSIVLTVSLKSGRVMTQTRRVKERSTNLGMIEKLNDLSRRACSSEMSVRELRAATSALAAENEPHTVLFLICYAVISAAFSVFFGGNGRDAAAALLSGTVLFLTLQCMDRLKVNLLIENVICSAATAFSVMLLVRAGLGVNPDKIMIGNIMLLIPGIQLTTSLRDIFNGDMIAGVLGLIDACVKALAIACGFAAVLITMGG